MPMAIYAVLPAIKNDLKLPKNDLFTPLVLSLLLKK